VKTPLFVALSVALVSSAADAKGDWEAVKQGDGIVVSRREAPGSDILVFRGEGDVDASVAVVATVIYDTTRAHEWVTDLKESRIIKWTSDDDYIEYDHVGTPFVLKDRDFVSTVKLKVNAAAQWVTFKYKPAADQAAPEAACCVRGELLDTTFVLTKVSATKTHVLAEVQIDPKGWIPKFVANWAEADWPDSTFRALRQQVKKSDITVDPHFTALVQ
jgi:hypothetical protein